jgi:protein gp37
MSDFFFHKVEDEHRDSIIEAIKTRPEVNFQILTKRPIEMLAYLSKRPPLPDNVWLGVTVENQARVSLISALHETGHQSIKFISVEPLLGPIELDLEGIDWLIVGGESGQHLMDPELREERGLVERVDAEKGKPAYWRPSERGYRLVQDLMRQSLEAGVPFFFKQWGGYRASATGSILNNAHYKEFPKT